MEPLPLSSSAIPVEKSSPWQQSRWWANVWHYLSITLWGNLSADAQRRISARYAQVYDQQWSRRLIPLYCRIHYPDPNYLEQFKPPRGKGEYETFQDFFTREFKAPLVAEHQYVWPCEGVLCHFGQVADIPTSNVKGDVRSVADIFGVAEGVIPDNYHFSNIFLHNKNYHRIHSPISGTIRRVQYIPDELVILRPWIYPYNPSVPAFRNERINVDIEDELGRIWYLSIVGGPAVGTIELPAAIVVGQRIQSLDELALFYLGSTCCMAAPVRNLDYPRMAEIGVGFPY